MTTILEGLVAQAEAQGTARVTLQALIEEAGQMGARRALRDLGLMDEHAGRDMGELRRLLDSWRTARRSLLSAVVGWLARMVVTMVLIGLAFKLGLVEGGKPGTGA